MPLPKWPDDAGPMSWADNADRHDAKNPRVSPPKPVKRAVYRPPKLGDTRVIDGRSMIYTARGWVVPYDPEGDYGGPYENACDLFLNKRYQSDMRDIYGLPFEPSKAEECRDAGHLRYWDRVRHTEDRHGVYIPAVPPRNQRSRNNRNSHFASLAYGVRRRDELREQSRQRRQAASGSRGRHRSRSRGSRSH
jgi:hypothetical protein